MEFINNNNPECPVMGRYKYVFSSENLKRFYFNTPTSFDAESERWFSQFQYTYCTFNGYCEALEGDEIDIWHFWEENPQARFRESYYEWEYRDQVCTEVDIKYTIAEYCDGEYWESQFVVLDVTEEQVAAMEQVLMNWHRNGKLIIGE